MGPKDFLYTPPNDHFPFWYFFATGEFLILSSDKLDCCSANRLLLFLWHQHAILGPADTLDTSLRSGWWYKWTGDWGDSVLPPGSRVGEDDCDWSSVITSSGHSLTYQDQTRHTLNTDIQYSNTKHWSWILQLCKVWALNSSDSEHFYDKSAIRMHKLL